MALSPQVAGFSTRVLAPNHVALACPFRWDCRSAAARRAAAKIWGSLTNSTCTSAELLPLHCLHMTQISWLWFSCFYSPPTPQPVNPCQSKHATYSNTWYKLPALTTPVLELKEFPRPPNAPRLKVQTILVPAWPLMAASTSSVNEAQSDSNLRSASKSDVPIHGSAGYHAYQNEMNFRPLLNWSHSLSIRMSVETSLWWKSRLSHQSSHLLNEHQQSFHRWKSAHHRVW